MIAARPAVFLVNGIGDQMIALPAVRALAHLYPEKLQLLLGVGLYNFFYSDLKLRNVGHVWWADYDKKVIDPAKSAGAGAGCDLFVSLSTWVTPSILELAKKLGAARTVGFYAAFDHAVSTDPSIHTFDRLFAIPRALDPSLRFEDFAGPLTLSPAAESAALRFIAAHASSTERILFVHPETRADKMWSRAALSGVLRRFLDARPDFRVFSCSMKPWPLDLGEHRSRVVHVDTHLELSLAILRRTHLFLGVDSCFLHAADLFRLPGVGLFGPTPPQQWGFRLSPHHRDFFGEGSMDRLDPGAVLESLVELAGKE